MTPTALVLVKHALPVLDPSRPAKEWQLGTEGELQAKRLASRLQVFAPLRLVTSPEPKALTTGQLVSAELGVDVTPVEGLQEFDRPVLPLMSKAEHERANAAIFTDLNRPVLGAESGRVALDRFAAAVAAELMQTGTQSLVVITHGTVISLFVAAHNRVDAFELWNKLVCASFVVVDVPSFSLREVGGLEGTR
jgi:broad specificity phosphatase PhoE